MWLNSRLPVGTLAQPEVQTLTTTPIATQHAAVPTDQPTTPPAKPPVVNIKLKGLLCENIPAIFVKFKMGVPPHSGTHYRTD